MDLFFSFFTFFLVVFIAKVYLYRRKKYTENMDVNDLMDAEEKTDDNKKDKEDDDGEKNDKKDKNNGEDGKKTKDQATWKHGKNNKHWSDGQPNKNNKQGHMDKAKKRGGGDSSDEVSAILDGIQNLPEVYDENTSGYMSSVDPETGGPIPIIPEAPTPDIPFPFNIIPIDDMIEGLNLVIGIFNKIIGIINASVFYAECGGMLLINFFIVPCVFWYVFYAFLKLLYLFPSLVFWCTGSTEFVENYIWGPIYLADEACHDMFGFHFAHFPDNINQACFFCPAQFRPMGASNFADLGSQILDFLIYFYSIIVASLLLFSLYLYIKTSNKSAT
jgi:hypothetical protein